MLTSAEKHYTEKKEKKKRLSEQESGKKVKKNHGKCTRFSYKMFN